MGVVNHILQKAYKSKYGHATTHLIEKKCSGFAVKAEKVFAKEAVQGRPRNSPVGLARRFSPDDEMVVTAQALAPAKIMPSLDHDHGALRRIHNVLDFLLGQDLVIQPDIVDDAIKRPGSDIP